MVTTLFHLIIFHAVFFDTPFVWCRAKVKEKPVSFFAIRPKKMAALLVLPVVMFSGSAFAYNDPGQTCGAGVCTQTVSVSQTLGNGSADFVPYNINASPFDPGFGTLLSATIEIMGTETPGVFRDLPVPPSPAGTTGTLSPSFFVEGPPVTGPASFTLMPQTFSVPAGLSSGANFVGNPIPVDVTVNLGILTTMEYGVAPDNLAPGIQALLEFGAISGLSLPYAGPGAGSDGTGFTGTATITYKYQPTPLPEPTTALVLGTGLLGLAWRRRHAGIRA